MELLSPADSDSLHLSIPDSHDVFNDAVSPMQGVAVGGDACQLKIMDSKDLSLFNHELVLVKDKILLRHGEKRDGPSIRVSYDTNCRFKNRYRSSGPEGLVATQAAVSECFGSGVEADDGVDDLFSHTLLGEVPGYHEELPWLHPNSPIWVGREDAHVAVVIEQPLQARRPYFRQPCAFRSREFTGSDYGKNSLANFGVGVWSERRSKSHVILYGKYFHGSFSH
ncbi:hypothetical protein HYALB_00004006 [Hymenoscyphus albidus]|uniref:Uncharacterized protein n=1 Tax=Hymenoscyphus albidus TaxID=595503 RepID=A0A9N9LY13_9HELO|nr:hypothetical protein HYALB_00004006 [Hymenoscyphus albidus]